MSVASDDEKESERRVMSVVLERKERSVIEKMESVEESKVC